MDHNDTIVLRPGIKGEAEATGRDRSACRKLVMSQRKCQEIDLHRP